MIKVVASIAHRHTDTDTHTDTYTDTHTDTQTHTHTHTHTHIHRHIHTHRHTHTDTHIHTHNYIYIYIYKYIYIYIFMIHIPTEIYYVKEESWLSGTAVVEHSSANPKVPGSIPGPVSYRAHLILYLHFITRPVLSNGYVFKPKTHIREENILPPPRPPPRVVGALYHCNYPQGPYKTAV